MTTDIRELPGKILCLAVGEGPPLVVFPGLARDSDNEGLRIQNRQRATYRRLASVTLRTVYLMHRPRQMVPGTTMAEIAAAQATAIRSCFTEPVDVLGISTGGAIALQLAVDHPSLVRKLVVAGAASWLGESGRQRLRKYGALISQGKSGACVLASVLAPKMLRGPAALLLWALSWQERHLDPTDMLTTIHAECEFDVTSRLGAITAPTLVVAGERDHAFSPELFRITANGIPNSCLLLYPRRGHIGALLDPRFGRDVGAFLNCQTPL
jgi:pimeloyl-ACP methyl ester carboxylesterase